MGLESQFLRDPAKFAGIHTLYPYADPVTNDAQIKKRSLDDGTEFSQVQGENKVAYCKILLPKDLTSLQGDSGGSYMSDQSLFVMRVSHLKTGSSAFPVYYLPWRSNYMMRIKLKPSPKHPTKEKHRFWADETVEPDIFITAALQGCSIFVSGEPDQPVVYHINASSTKGPRDETLNSKDDDEFRGRGRGEIEQDDAIASGGDGTVPEGRGEDLHRSRRSLDEGRRQGRPSERLHARHAAELAQAPGRRRKTSSGILRFSRCSSTAPYSATAKTINGASIARPGPASSTRSRATCIINGASPCASSSGRESAGRGRDRSSGPPRYECDIFTEG